MMNLYLRSMLQNNQKEVIEKELHFSFSRSGGSGGQHANKSSTRVELNFDVDASRGLRTEQKKRIFSKLHNRINSEGVLQISCEEERSQHQNKKIVTDRFFEMLELALIKPKKRKKTAPSKAARKKRLEEKKKKSEKKKRRRDDNLPGL